MKDKVIAKPRCKEELNKIKETTVEKPPTKKQVLDSITKSLRQVKRYQEGKLQLQTVQQLLDEG